jgi:hypothetical protein
MSDLTDLSASSQRIPDPETYEAIISEDATAGQPVYVVIPEFDPHLNHGPCPWTPIVTPDGIFFPHKGDPAIVIQPEAGNPWIAGWEPTAMEPDAVIAGSGDKHRTMPFTAASTVTLDHNLGKNPSVTVVDSAGTEWSVQVEHLSENTCRFTLAHAFSGTAYLN